MAVADEGAQEAFAGGEGSFDGFVDVQEGDGFGGPGEVEASFGASGCLDQACLGESLEDFGQVGLGGLELLGDVLGGEQFVLVCGGEDRHGVQGEGAGF